MHKCFWSAAAVAVIQSESFAPSSKPDLQICAQNMAASLVAMLCGLYLTIVFIWLASNQIAGWAMHIAKLQN